MTKISRYAIDDKVTGSDKWIGSDAQTQYTTKNFTPTKLAVYFNENQIIDIGTPIRYKYDILEVGDVRLPGTITFDPQVGTPYSLSNISSFILSKHTLKGNDVTQYLNFLIGSKVLIYKADDINIFGLYNVVSLIENITEPAFFDVVVSYITGNGSIVEDKDYLISLIDITSGNIPTKTSDLINDGEDGINPFITLQDIPPSTTPNLNSVLLEGNTSLLDAKIGELYLYDTTITNYGKIQLNNNVFTVTNSLNNNIISSEVGTLRVWNTLGVEGIFNYTSLTGGRIYNLPDNSGTIALTSDLASYVPYTGATGDINIGNNSIYTDGGAKLWNNGIVEGTSFQFAGYVGSLQSIASTNKSWLLPDASGTIALTSDIPTKTSDLINDGENGINPFITLNDIPTVTGFVPYTGATQDVDLGLFDITAAHLIKDGGQASQFLKADGSVDNNIYLTSADLPSTLDLYATTTASDVSGYTVLVRNISDSRFNTTAVDVSTGVITTTAQLVGSLVSDANIISGNPGIFNITTIGNISRTSGTGQAEFFFRVYKRDNLGVETFITESSKTLPVTNGGYVEFSAVALWNDGIFTDTDRVVLKYYADRLTSPVGSNPVYKFQFGGISPVRSTAAIPVAVLPNIYLRDLADVENVDALNNEVLYWNDTASLWEHSLVIDLLSPASSTVNGYLSSTDWTAFNGKFNLPSLTSGSVLFSNGTTIAQKNSNFFWDDTNNRLGIGTATAPSGSIYINNSGTDVRQHLVLKNSNSSSTAQVHLDLHNDASGNSYSAGASLFFCSTTYSAPYASALGFWNYQNGPIAFATNASERMRISATGNLLINTTTDNGGKLQIKAPGALSTDIALRVRNSADTADLMTVNGLGNVGIGTNAPTDNLNVVGGITTKAAASNTQITMYDENSSTYTQIIKRRSNNAGNFGLPVGSSEITTNTAFGINSNAYVAFATSGTERARFAATTGNLLINTTTDNGGKLQIKAPGALSTDIALRVRNSADTGDLATIGGTGILTVGGIGNKATINLARESNGGIMGAIIQPADFTEFYNYQGSGFKFFVTSTSNLIRTFITDRGIGITGTTGGIFTLDASALLQGNSTTQGFLPPRMTTTQRDAIATPATGLQVYNTTLGTQDFYNGTSWNRFGSQTLIKAPGALSTDIALSVRNSADTGDLLLVRGDNFVTVNKLIPTEIVFNGGAQQIGINGIANLTRYYSSGLVGQKIQSQTGYNLLLSPGTVAGQTVIIESVGGVGVTISNSAILQANSTTQGFLPPRMTNAQRIAIATPAVGLCVYCTDAVEGLYINKSTGWTYIG